MYIPVTMGQYDFRRLLNEWLVLVCEGPRTDATVDTDFFSQRFSTNSVLDTGLRVDLVC